MKVRIINRSANPLPSYETAGSAGMDLRADLPDPIMIHPLERMLVPTGISIELPDGYEAQVRPRSGIAIKKGISLVNTPGTIDSDYRGEIKVILVNLSNETHQIKPGDRIAQMVISQYSKVEWIEAESIADTQRGEGGFGHTGTQ